ncbi:MAG: competence/damage-inducible protein A [Bradymonadales bacterium]|nr:competence/damage-inducible protein A [Bradymonadales bacterium]
MERKSAHTPTAAILLIGDELLSGKVADENGSYLIGTLREMGVAIREIRVISDTVEAIAGCARQLSERYDHLFTSGGIGPTHDDVTLAGMALAFEVPLVENALLAHHLAALFGGDQVRQAAFLKMAQVPEGTVLIWSSGLRWPLYTYRNIYLLPGIPEIFRRQFDAIKDRFLSTPFFLRTIYYRLHEGVLAPVLTQACQLYPGASFGSYPILHEEHYQVRITVESKEKRLVEEASDWLLDHFGRESIFKVVDGAE